MRYSTISKPLIEHTLHKEAIVNENFEMIEFLMWNNSAVSISRREVPSNPNEYDKYIIPIDLTFDDKTNDIWDVKYQSHIAIFILNRWKFIKPVSGMLIWIIDEKKFVLFMDGSWVNVTSIGMENICK